jgi:hypothetical protein
MATFNLNSTSSQNYSTVVGENVSFPIDMLDLEVLWDEEANAYESIGDYLTSNGNYALNGLISEIITVGGREAYFTFEDLSGLTGLYHHSYGLRLDMKIVGVTQKLLASAKSPIVMEQALIVFLSITTPAASMTKTSFSRMTTSSIFMALCHLTLMKGDRSTTHSI